MTGANTLCIETRSIPPPEADLTPIWEELAEKSRYDRHRLAKLLHVSVRTLDRHFQKRLSVSVSQWLMELQMADAYQQVLTGKPLKEISFDVGCKQPSQFT